MKKICVLLVTMFFGFQLQARDNGFGVRAGVNIASMTNFNSKVGFHVGGMYRLQLMSATPIFFEPGLELQFKGGKLTQSGVSTTLNLVYVNIPAIVAYRFQFNDKWAIQPALGPYFSFGVSGTMKQSSMGRTQSMDTFGSNGVLKRGDVGMRFSLGAMLNRIYFGFGYDLSFVNLPKNYTTGNPKLRNGCFYLSAGYNF